MSAEFWSSEQSRLGVVLAFFTSRTSDYNLGASTGPELLRIFRRDLVHWFGNIMRFDQSNHSEPFYTQPILNIAETFLMSSLAI